MAEPEEKPLPNIPPGWKLHAKFTPTESHRFTGSSTCKVEVETWVTSPDGNQVGDKAKSTFSCTVTEDGNGKVTMTPTSEGDLQTKDLWPGGQLHAQFVDMEPEANSDGYKTYTGKVEAICAYGATNDNKSGNIIKIEHQVTLYVSGVKKEAGQTLP